MNNSKLSDEFKKAFWSNYITDCIPVHLRQFYKKEY